MLVAGQRSRVATPIEAAQAARQTSRLEPTRSSLRDGWRRENCNDILRNKERPSKATSTHIIFSFFFSRSTKALLRAALQELLESLPDWKVRETLCLVQRETRRLKCAKTVDSERTGVGMCDCP